jgi:hypothetical protein
MVEKSVAQKLFLKPGRTIAIVNAPSGATEILLPLPEFAKMIDTPEIADVVLLFTRDFSDFNRAFLPLAKSIKREAILWVAYPKKSSKITSDLDRDKLNVYAQSLGWLGVFMIAFDEDWSAMRLKPK